MRIHPLFRRLRKRESGYVLMVILLMLALLLIALVAIAPREATQIRREREEETIHRGNEYARAVQRFYRKFVRYPTRVEELENTNNSRFLRKRYTDPMTGQEFRLLHYGEQKTVPKGLFGAPLGVAGATGVGGGAVGAGAMNGGLAGAVIGNAMGGSPMGGGNPARPDTDARRGQTPGTPASSISSPMGGSGPTFGGGPIIGVAGTKDQASLKDWNGKSNYKDWEFYYDPRFDVQGQGGGNIGGLPGAQPGANPVVGPSPGPAPNVQPPQPK